MRYKPSNEDYNANIRNDPRPKNPDLRFIHEQLKKQKKQEKNILNSQLYKNPKIDLGVRPYFSNLPLLN